KELCIVIVFLRPRLRLLEFKTSSGVIFGRNINDKKMFKINGIITTKPPIRKVLLNSLRKYIL
nr:hypothetical protein [Bacillus pacificus]